MAPSKSFLPSHSVRGCWLLCLGLIPALGPGLYAQATLAPSALKVLKEIATSDPVPKITTFSIGGFQVERVEAALGATAAHFSGEGLFLLPAPLGPRKLAFQDLVIQGGVATGQVSQELSPASTSTHQGWAYVIRKVAISDEGSHLEGTATLAGIRLEIEALTFTPQGLAGSINPGELWLSEGPFAASLQQSEVVFGVQSPQLKGHLRVEIEAPVRHARTGEIPVLEGGPVAFSSDLLSGTGLVLDPLASNLPLLHKGSTWRMDQVSFGFERGTPILSGPTHLQFPLQVFCKVGATDQPYSTDAAPCQIRGRVPPLESSTASGRARVKAIRESLFHGVGEAWEGFSGSFPLPPAQLLPSGLSSYHLALEGGHATVLRGVVEPDSTAITCHLNWGPEFQYQVAYQEVPAALSDGFYAQGGKLKDPVQVGAYHVMQALGGVVADFSPSRSPKDLPGEWQGLLLPAYYLSFPIDLYRFTADMARYPACVMAASGRFEANGGFDADLTAKFSDDLMLHVVPVKLDPFDLSFVDGVLVKGPVVTGHLDLQAPTLLPKFEAPVSFHLVQGGLQQIEIQTQTPEGNLSLDTGLLGVDIVLEAATLHPTNLDLSGRFDFHVAGANLPSVPFDHLVLEASGGGIEGDNGPLKLGVSGNRWDTLSTHPTVKLWGYDFGLSESGFGVQGDGRFFVGFGGEMDINPLLPSMPNRVLFTSDAQQKPTVELASGFHIDQSMANLGSLVADLGFHVETAGDEVSDAYFLGSGNLKVDFGDMPVDIKAGLRLGRSFQNTPSFPYFYALGHFQAPEGGIEVAPDLEVYGLVGGLAQNFKPVDIRNTESISGTADASLGLAVIAGVDIGTSDEYTFHGDLDLYIAQNLTTLLQGKGWLMCSRDQEPDDNKVTANVAFTRNPNVFNATFGADLKQYGGLVRYVGTVELHFSPDLKYVHIGTKNAPLQALFSNGWQGDGYLTADFQDHKATFGAGAGFSFDSGDRGFGLLYGRLWLNAHGDLVIELEGSSLSARGTINAEGGAEFGMEFDTFWHDYHITIFSGSLATSMAFQAPGSPMLSGRVTIHYSVLGGAFEGSVSAHMDF